MVRVLKQAAAGRAGSRSAISPRGDFPVSCVFWSLVMNPSIVAWERRPLGFLRMPEG